MIEHLFVNCKERSGDGGQRPRRVEVLARRDLDHLVRLTGDALEIVRGILPP